MQTLYEQLDIILTPHFPEQKEREEKSLILGQLVISNVYLQILDGLDGENKTRMIEILNDGESEDIMSAIQEAGFDLPAMIEKELQEALSKTVA